MGMHRFPLWRCKLREEIAGKPTLVFFEEKHLSQFFHLFLIDRC